nr:MAG TPA: hypothetical protein [Caudoviricetes sp.]
MYLPKRLFIMVVLLHHLCLERYLNKVYSLQLVKT